MLRSKYTSVLLTIALIVSAAVGGAAQEIQRQGDDDQPIYYSDRPRIDRYLDAEVWVDRSDNEYYIGDNIVINFRVSRDAFVAIYTVDTRGMVNLLFPSDPGEDNFVKGGQTYRLPNPRSGYDLVVSGPEGVENIQIIASRENFPIPNWYRNSGLVSDWDDRYDFMDYVNGRYFVKYDGQRFAYNRAVIFVNEWEQYYFRPVYYPAYPSWSMCGNVYIDYGWGHSVYVNGVYWGITPLYVPRIAVGWHTFTIYDPWGYCWENDVHISYYNTVVLNRTIIRPSPSVKSKYKVVREAGYRDPVSAGYTNYAQKTKAVLNKDVSSSKIVTQSAGKSADGSTASKSVRAMAFSDEDVKAPATKKFVRGSTTLSKTDRGYESDLSAGSAVKSKAGSAQANTYRATNNSASNLTESGRYKSKRDDSPSAGSSGASGQSSGYYQKKSGATTTRPEVRSSGDTRSSGSSESGTYRKSRGADSPSRNVAPSKQSNDRGATVKPAQKPSNQPSSSGTYRKAPAPSKSGSGEVKQSAPANKPAGKPANSQGNSSVGKGSNTKGSTSSPASKGSSSSSSKSKGKGN